MDFRDIIAKNAVTHRNFNSFGDDLYRLVSRPQDGNRIFTENDVVAFIADTDQLNYGKLIGFFWSPSVSTFHDIHLRMMNSRNVSVLWTNNIPNMTDISLSYLDDVEDAFLINYRHWNSYLTFLSAKEIPLSVQSANYFAKKFVGTYESADSFVKKMWEKSGRLDIDSIPDIFSRNIDWQGMFLDLLYEKKIWYMDADPGIMVFSH